MSRDEHRRKIRELNRHRGIPNRISPDATVQHLKLLRATMSWTQITAATGCSSGHLRQILRGDWPAINRLTQEKVLAVRPATERAPGAYIDATPSVRRVRALMAAGHAQYTIAEAGGTVTTRVRLLAEGQPRMRQMLATKIETAWVQLSATTGTSARARNMAAARGWPDPTWWEDYGRIDDPSFDPAAVTERTLRSDALAEDWEWLEPQGYSRQHAAERLGVSRDTLNAAIARGRALRSDMETAA
ncbi:hypothetical protein H3146_05825 [Streptomyces sp. OF3]|uniref:Uncharacterized protein n=1 Tax=Streptomyces alkaliterrae TaxID=2213162 RepID=A0A7W3WJ90_9ACTN|nr:hypothetical protein [Streptomyces alkaliterrae]MBB1252885.1 hypothetical protein [Streptomyces alkaliterrae]